MAPPRSYRCEALTLKKFSSGEADLIVTLYARDNGKLRVSAKGARRSTSKLVGHLEPLSLVNLALAQARNLDIVTQAQTVDNFARLKSDLKAMAKGVYLAELVDGFGSEAQPNQALYHLAIGTLHAIGDSPDSDWPLHFFELHLLQVSGLMPELYHCVGCRAELAPERHRFSASMGGTVCPDCSPEGAYVRPLSLRALKVLRLLHRGQLADILPLRTDETLRQELKIILSGTVEYWLDRRVRSSEFLDHLHRKRLLEV